MNFIELATNKVLSEADFRNANPNVSFPQVLTPEIAASFGCAELEDGAQPTFNADTQYPSRDGVEQVDGKWRIKWVVKDYTAEELAARQPPSVAEKLASVGLTIDDLKAALGL